MYDSIESTNRMTIQKKERNVTMDNEALIELEPILKSISESKNFGVTKCNTDALLTINYLNKGLSAMLGYEESDLMENCQGLMMKLIYETDRLDFKQRLRHSYDSMEPLNEELRLKRKDNSIMWVHFYGRIYETQAGVNQIVCVWLDINELKNVEHQLRIQSERYNILEKITQDPIFEYDDLSDTLMLPSQGEKGQMRLIHNYRKEIDNSGYICPEDLEQYKKDFDDSLIRENFISYEFRNKFFENEYTWYRVAYTTIKNVDDDTVRMVGKFININGEKKKELELIEKSMYDSMTKLYNRPTIKSRIEDFLDKQKQGCHALLIIDIDNFKLVNDNLGHLFGDTVLTNFAEQLARIFDQEKDYIGRIGGDEFMAFLTDTNRDEIERKAHKTCSVFDYLFSGTLNNIHVSTSVGISVSDVDGTDYLSLFQKADQALYFSKQSGKNQYNFFKEDFGKVLAASEDELMSRYRMETRERGNSQATKEMIEFSFHILTETSDLNAGIGLVIEALSKKLGVETAMLFEDICIEKKQKIELSFLWEKERGIIYNEETIEVKRKEWMSITNRLKKGQFFEITDFEKQYGITEFVDILRHTGVLSAILKGIVEDGELKGMMLFADHQKARKWSLDEKNMIQVTEKIIASYLLKMRNTQLVEEQVNQLTNYDNVTGLCKLKKFKKDVKRILAKNQTGKKYMLLYSDIRNFRNINDIYGYQIGDMILKTFAETISSADNFVLGCRDFSDNFVILLDYNEYENFMFYIICLNNMFAETVKRNVVNHNLKIATGAYLIENRSLDVSQMIDAADLARKEAKKSSIRDFVRYDEKMAIAMAKKQKIELSMEQALENDEFKVFLQSKHDIKDGHIVGAEALIRWRKPDDTYIYPDEFIPLFEQNGFISQIDFFVLNTVCEIIKHRVEAGLPVVKISVNQSRYLLRDLYYVEKVKRVLDIHQIPLEYLELELTESLFFEDSRTMIDTMRKLKKLGITLSIDDFGAGYSSLNVLKDLPADIIKMDKEFLSNSEDKKTEIIITKTVEMAKELEKVIVCEGVETRAQADFLARIDCDIAQGYLFSKAVPMEEFFTTLEKEYKTYGKRKRKKKSAYK